MEKVANGVFVSLHYKGTLQNGEVFDTSKGRDPLEVQMGEGLAALTAVEYFTVL